MPEIKGIDLFKWGAAIVALATAWATMDARVQAQAVMMADHEARIRSMENLVLVALGDLKGEMKSEFHGIKIRVTALEKAVERTGGK